MPVKNKTVLYEINAPVWLNRLSRQHGREIKFASVPDEELQKLAGLHVDMVWIMGVWERSPRAIAIGDKDPGLQKLLRRTLPDFKQGDYIGSAYSIRDYSVNRAFGDKEGLAKLRSKLAGHGIGLMLDFVPNHTAPDHPWIAEHPEYYVSGDQKDIAKHPKNFIDCDGAVFANGRDPQFDAWSDVVQLNAFSEDYRQQAAKTLRDIAAQCDGVRCDMSMLMMNKIFKRSWGKRAGQMPEKDFWEEVIANVRLYYPDFTFMAETYWDTEEALIEQGFDYCYDKPLYDIVLEHGAKLVKNYIHKDHDYREHLARFIENHDERRAVAAFPAKREQAAAAIVATMPGMWLVHDGEMEGYETRIPVHLARGPVEEINDNLYDFHKKLLDFTAAWKDSEAEWSLLQTNHADVLAWAWKTKRDKYAVIINFGHEPRETMVLDGSEMVIAGHHLKPWQVMLLAPSRPGTR